MRLRAWLPYLLLVPPAVAVPAEVAVIATKVLVKFSGLVTTSAPGHPAWVGQLMGLELVAA